MDLITLAMAKPIPIKKAGYVEVSEAVIFENLAVSGGEADTTVTTQMIPGKTYIVTVGGVKYERVCYTEAFDGIACVGNARLYDFVNEDNGDDFFVGQARETIVQCYTRNMGDTTITLAEKTETIHPIDPKYLPGVCLPVVELTTEPTVGTSASLTADESAKLDEVVTLKTPIVLNFVYPDMGEMSCVCFYMASANGFVHHFSFGNTMTLIVGYGDGAWYTSLTEG